MCADLEARGWCNRTCKKTIHWIQLAKTSYKSTTEHPRQNAQESSFNGMMASNVQTAVATSLVSASNWWFSLKQRIWQPLMWNAAWKCQHVRLLVDIVNGMDGPLNWLLILFIAEDLRFFLNCFSTVIATNLLLVDEMMRAGMSSLKG